MSPPYRVADRAGSRSLPNAGERTRRGLNGSSWSRVRDTLNRFEAWPASGTYSTQIESPRQKICESWGLLRLPTAIGGRFYFAVCYFVVNKPQPNAKISSTAIIPREIVIDLKFISWLSRAF